MVPKTLWNKLHRGESVTIDSKTFTPEMVLGQERKGIKLSYITDTRPIEKNIFIYTSK